MKGTNFRRILCILIAAMLCIGLLPIGAAADSYAAAAELRSMQKVRREIDGELFELESELDSDLSAVETVDSLFEYLDGDSRIKSINRQNGTTFGYTLKSGMTVVYDYNIVHKLKHRISENALHRFRHSYRDRSRVRIVCLQKLFLGV